MDFLADQLRQFTDSRDIEDSCLKKSIALLNRRIGWVPKGWVQLYQDLVKSLLNLNDDAHGNSIVVGPWVEDVKMDFTPHDLTPAVAGILRKAMQRSLCTCKNCGLPGKPRSFGEATQDVLCARCFAPRELAVQLALWIPRLESMDFFDSEQEFPVDDFDSAFLALLPQSSWRWLPDQLEGRAIPYLKAKDLFKLLPDLKNLHALIAEMAAADE